MKVHEHQKANSCFDTYITCNWLSSLGQTFQHHKRIKGEKQKAFKFWLH